MGCGCSSTSHDDDDIHGDDAPFDSTYMHVYQSIELGLSNVPTGVKKQHVVFLATVDPSSGRCVSCVEEGGDGAKEPSRRENRETEDGESRESSKYRVRDEVDSESEEDLSIPDSTPHPEWIRERIPHPLHSGILRNGKLSLSQLPDLIQEREDFLMRLDNDTDEKIELDWLRSLVIHFPWIDLRRTKIQWIPDFDLASDLRRYGFQPFPESEPSAPPIANGVPSSGMNDKRVPLSEQLFEGELLFARASLLPTPSSWVERSVAPLSSSEQGGTSGNLSISFSSFLKTHSTNFSSLSSKRYQVDSLAEERAICLADAIDRAIRKKYLEELMSLQASGSPPDSIYPEFDALRPNTTLNSEPLFPLSAAIPSTPFPQSNLSIKFIPDRKYSHADADSSLFVKTSLTSHLPESPEASILQFGDSLHDRDIDYRVSTSTRSDVDELDSEDLPGCINHSDTTQPQEEKELKGLHTNHSESEPKDTPLSVDNSGLFVQVLVVPLGCQMTSKFNLLESIKKTSQRARIRSWLQSLDDPVDEEEEVVDSPLSSHAIECIHPLNLWGIRMFSAWYLSESLDAISCNSLSDALSLYRRISRKIL